VLETEDEKILQYAHTNQSAFSASCLIIICQSSGNYQLVPIVIVFTKYDQLVRIKETALREDYPLMEPTNVHNLGVEEAWKTFGIWLGVLRRTINRLGIPMPFCATVSGIFFAPLYYLVLTTC
jgi:hypothetical protein